MDKKVKKKEVKAVKRKAEDNLLENDSKKKSIGQRIRFEEAKDGQKIEVLSSHPIEYTVAPNQQLIQTNQMVEGYDQPVFVSVKGEPVQLGPNTVIVYEQSGAPANFAFSGNIVMDSSGRLVVAEPIYDVKDNQHDAGRVAVNTASEVELPSTESHELSAGSGAGTGTATHSSGGVGYNNPVYQYSKVTIVDDTDANNDNVQIIEDESTNGIETISDEDVVKWMNPKLTDVMRKLQMNYDAGVKLMLSPTGCIQCIYFTTPSMQLAFNSVPQFLCIQTGIEFSTVMVGNAGIRHNVCLFLAEDGNGKSVIVSGGISTFGDNLQWLLETFKSCNPAWRQVRCIVAEPNKHKQDVRASFPNAHVTSNVYQICREVTRLCLALYQEENGTTNVHDDPDQKVNIYQKVKDYVLAKINSDLEAHINNLKYSLLWRHCSSKLEEAMMAPDGPLTKLEQWLEGENNYTNVLHKGLEKIVAKFTMVSASTNIQPESFISWFFQVANQVEEERRSFAIARLQETMNVMGNGGASASSIPADTITQYACSLMSHQTTLAQRALDSANIKGNGCKCISEYGTSTQECSCLFSKVFRLPCRHILMLTTELKVKTHIPFEPRWTIQHCLFGCGVETTSQNASSSACYEQLVVNSTSDNTQQHHMQQGTIASVVQQQHQQPQYVLASQPTGQPQVIFCTTSSGGVASAGGGVVTTCVPPVAVTSPVITSVVGGAVLTPVQAHERA